MPRPSFAAIRRNDINKVLSSRPFKRLVSKVRRRQNALHQTASDQAWHAYLAVEQAANERLADSIDVVADWAYEQGRRDERRRQGSR